jgi:hypothetical protein
MNELKCKLKLKGKAAGYMRVTQIGERLWVQQRRDDTEEWLDGDWMEFDSIHPFVCLDRNGKDVYEGDHVLAQSHHTREHEATVHWDPNCAGFLIDEYKWNWPHNLNDYLHIELIPEVCP